jgi:hypothetical protein
LHIERERVKQLESELALERSRKQQGGGGGGGAESQQLQGQVAQLSSTVTNITSMETRLREERDLVSQLQQQLRADITAAKELRAASQAEALKAKGASPNPKQQKTPRSPDPAAEHERAVVEDLRAMLLAEKQKVRELLKHNKHSGGAGGASADPTDTVGVQFPTSPTNSKSVKEIFDAATRRQHTSRDPSTLKANTTDAHYTMFPSLRVRYSFRFWHHFAHGDVLVRTMLLGLKPGHACDVISAVTEFMVDVARVEA